MSNFLNFPVALEERLRDDRPQRTRDILLHFFPIGEHTAHDGLAKPIGGMPQVKLTM
jgi:hypothetical protein